MKRILTGIGGSRDGRFISLSLKGDFYMKVGLIHTTLNSVEPSNAAFRKIDSSIEIVNYLNEGIMPELRSTGASSRIMSEMMQFAWAAERAGCQGIMLNCSLMSPYAVDMARLVNIPLISADIAMLEYVVAKASTVGVVATVAKAGPTTARLLQDLAARQGKKIDVEVKIAEGAFEALNNSDEESHNRIIHEAAKAYDGKVDLIVFAQISMTRALEGLKLQTQVATSPQISAKTLLERIRGGA